MGQEAAHGARGGRARQRPLGRVRLARLGEADLEGLTRPPALARVVRLTRAAGAIAMRHFRGKLRAWEKTPGAIVTEADLEIDAFLAGHLPEPGDAWLSEESADDRRRLEADRVWIVDPIDGTRSFAAGRPEFAVSVALWSRAAGTTVLALVLNPATDELFVALRGAGAWRNGVPLGLSPWTEGAATRLLVSGREARKAGLDRLVHGAEVRGLGSLAYRLALVAAGEADGLVSLRRVADWDLAAAMLLVAEAGGLVTDRRGRPLTLNGVVPTHDGLVVGTAALHRVLGDAVGAIAA